MYCVFYIKDFYLLMLSFYMILLKYILSLHVQWIFRIKIKIKFSSQNYIFNNNMTLSTYLNSLYMMFMMRL